MAESHEGPAKPSFSLFLAVGSQFPGVAPLCVLISFSCLSLSRPLSLLASLDQWPPNGSLAFSG